MAAVDVYTKAHIDTMTDALVQNASIDSNGYLHLTMGDGVTDINVGQVQASAGSLFLNPTGDTTGVLDTAALLTLVTNAIALFIATGLGTRIVLGAGKFYIQTHTIKVTQPAITIDGQGKNVTFVYGVGSGDIFDWSYSGTYSGKLTVGGGAHGMTIVGVNTTASVAYTATNASPAVFTATASNLAEGQPVSLSGGSVPTGFSNATIYFAKAVTANTFELSAAPFGTALNSTSTGNGNVLPGSCAIHAGDIESLSFKEIYIRDFNTGPAHIGLHLDNRNYWTERADIDIHFDDVWNAVVLDVSDNAGGSPHSSTSSFARLNLVAHITPNSANFNGIVLANGAIPYGSYFKVRGNFQATSGTLASNPYSQSNSPAVFTITGQTPTGHTGAGAYSRMYNVTFDVDVECSSNTNKPQTIVFDSVGQNNIRGWTGTLDFDASGKNFAGSNVLTGANNTRGPNAFWGFGIINGDGGLSLASNGTDSPFPALTCSLLYSEGSALTNGASMDVYTRDGDFFKPSALTANVTINLNPGGTWSGTLGGAQRTIIILTQSAGSGPYTVSWPTNGSPTTASPNVVWTNGVTPVMSQSPSGIDVYELVTRNGATWYGRVISQTNPTTISSSETGLWSAKDNGYLAWCQDPEICRDNLLCIAGTVYLRKIPIKKYFVATKMAVSCGTIAAGTSTQSFCGMIQPTGALLTGSSDIGSTFLSTGEKELTFTSAHTLYPGLFAQDWIWGVLLFNMSVTQPSLLGIAAQGGQGNVNLAAANSRSATGGTAQTALPSPLTPSSNGTSSKLNIWMALL